MTDNLIFWGYAIFMFVGAYFGFKKGSKVSLIAGLASGVLVLVGIWLKAVNVKTGYMFLGGLTGILTIVFLMRLMKTKNFMPSGMLLIITLGVLAVTVIRLTHIPS